MKLVQRGKSPAVNPRAPLIRVHIGAPMEMLASYGYPRTSPRVQQGKSMSFVADYLKNGQKLSRSEIKEQPLRP